MGKFEITVAEKIVTGQARTAFEQYATFDGDVDATDWPELRKLQVKLIRWQVANFGAQPLSTATLGVTEEGCWELVEAVEEDNAQNTYDALGDIMVFACNGCSLLRLDFYKICQGFDADKLTQPSGDLGAWFTFFKAVGSLAHVTLKESQKIRGYHDREKARADAGAAFMRMMSMVHWFAFNGGWDAESLFMDVATHVLKRDFTKNAVSGDAEVETNANEERNA